MRAPVISDVEQWSMHGWLAALALVALLSGCTASRSAVCSPGGDARRTVPDVAGGFLVRVAEVIVGADFVDHERDDQRTACPNVAEKDRPGGVEALPTAPSAPPPTVTVPQAPEHAAGAPKLAHTKRPRPSARAATKAKPAGDRSERWILVRKSARTLSVFDAARRVKTYPVVFGKDPVGPKLYEGDRRTPEGEYHIISKHAHPEWQRFLLLDYPNADNREVYAWSRAKGLVPARGGRVAGTGGAIGVHGTGDDELNRKGINWTYGCISLLTRDIRQLDDIVPVGTLVVIEP